MINIPEITDTLHNRPSSNGLIAEIQRFSPEVAAAIFADYSKRYGEDRHDNLWRLLDNRRREK